VVQIALTGGYSEQLLATADRYCDSLAATQVVVLQARAHRIFRDLPRQVPQRLGCIVIGDDCDDWMRASSTSSWTRRRSVEQSVFGWAVKKPSRAVVAVYSKLDIGGAAPKDRSNVFRKLLTLRIHLMHCAIGSQPARAPVWPWFSPAVATNVGR